MNPDIASAWLLIGFLVLIVLSWAAAAYMRRLFYSGFPDNDELLRKERKAARIARKKGSNTAAQFSVPNPNKGGPPIEK